MLVLYLLVSVVVIVRVLHYILNCNPDMRTIKKIPGPKEFPLVGNFWELIFIKLSIRKPPTVEIFKILRSYAKKYNGIYSIWSMGLKAVNIYNPQDAEVILSNPKHNNKSILYNCLKPWLGNGLLLSSGNKWHHRRKMLTGAFHFSILREFHGVFEDNNRRFLEDLEKTKGETVDLSALVTDYTLDTICETSMGTKLNTEHASARESYKNAIQDFGKITADRVFSLLFDDFTYKLTTIVWKSKAVVHKLHSFSGRVINERRQQFINSPEIDMNVDDEDNDFINKRKRKAMLDMLILAEKEGKIDKSGIQEEVDTFMFEGHDTSSAGLTYCFMLLANHKNVQNKIFKELCEVFGDSLRVPSMDDLAKLKYLECCIKESLRLYPPVPLIGRKLTEAVTLSNYTVPAGTFVHIHIYDLHRREDLFENASQFNPDRFLPENCVGRHPYAYIPFSAGPRNCIGQKLAMLEMKSCVATVMRNFELNPVTRPEDIEFSSDIVLRNHKPVFAQFVTRK